MPSIPDWRSEFAYAYCNCLNSKEIAWEFLRRDPSYRTDYLAAIDALGTGKADAIVARLGLRFPFDPDRRADEARPVWLPHLDRNVVLLAPAPKGFISIYCALFAEDADNGWFRIRSAAVS